MSDITPTPPKRRWLRFGIRTILVLMVLVAIPLAWKMNRVRAQRRAVKIITGASGTVGYIDYTTVSTEDLLSGNYNTDPGPEWLRQWVGDDLLANVVRVTIYDLSRPELFEALPELPGLHIVEICIDESTKDLLSDELVRRLRECKGLQRIVVTDSLDTGLQNLDGRATPKNPFSVKRLHEALPNCTLVHLNGVHELKEYPPKKR